MAGLNIKFLGEFSITYKDKTINDQNNRSKKMWALIEYLMIFRDKEISQNDLIELLWAESESENPTGALKTLLHRARTALDELEYIPGQEIIKQRSGAYFWNKKIEFTIDADEFEVLCKKAQQPGISIEDKLSLSMQAIELYKGDFLPKNALEPWVVPINTYYHSMYLNMAHETISILDSQDRHADIINVCRKTTTIDMYDETFHYYLIKALAAQGKHKQAVDRYDYVIDLLYKKFGVNPSEELTKLYKQIIKEERIVETDLNLIKKKLSEETGNAGAFYCQFEFFKDIYRIEARAAARTGSSIFILLITIVDALGDNPPQKTLNKAMDRLSESIKLSLRRGDIYTRYSVSQFMIMVPNLTFENSEMVADRIITNFRKANPKLFVFLRHKIQPLDPNIN